MRSAHRGYGTFPRWEETRAGLSPYIVKWDLHERLEVGKNKPKFMVSMEIYHIINNGSPLKDGAISPRELYNNDPLLFIIYSLYLVLTFTMSIS